MLEIGDLRVQLKVATRTGFWQRDTPHGAIFVGGDAMLPPDPWWAGPVISGSEPERASQGGR
jgi:hypothetical protein